MKIENNPLMLSLLVSQNKSNDHDVTLIDLKYKHCPRVSECQVKLYTMVINMLSEGKSYEEIISAIDKIDIAEYNRLNDNEQSYVKMRVKRDVYSRKNNEENRGVINNE